MNSSVEPRSKATRQTVLVTGASPRAAEAASALRGAGAAPVLVDDLPLGIGIGGVSFDAYLQLPAMDGSAGLSGREWAEHALTAAVPGRFRTASMVLPWLSHRARVVLVSPDLPAKPGPDSPPAARALMRALGHALRAEHAPKPLAVQICEHACSAEELAAAVLRPEQRGPAPGPAEDTPAAYADWRAEVLGLIGPQT